MTGQASSPNKPARSTLSQHGKALPAGTPSERLGAISTETDYSTSSPEISHTTIRADAFAYVGRHLKKRQFRSLWITRLTAAVKQHGLRYSQFIHGVQKAGIKLNRKELSELAIHDPSVFEQICKTAQAQLA